MALPKFPFRKRVDYPPNIAQSFRSADGIFRVPDQGPEYWHIEGFAPSIAAGTEVMLWDGSAASAAPDASLGATVDIVSDSAEDDPDKEPGEGSGAHGVIIFGFVVVDAALVVVLAALGITVEVGTNFPVYEEIALNGAAAVVTTWRFTGIHHAYCISSTSGSTPNVGTITFTETGGAGVLAIIRPTVGRTYNGYFPRLTGGYGTVGTALDPKLALVEYTYKSEAGQDLSFIIRQFGAATLAYPGTAKNLVGALTEDHVFAAAPSAFVPMIGLRGGAFGLYCTNNGVGAATNVYGNFTFAMNVGWLDKTNDIYTSSYW